MPHDDLSCSGKVPRGRIYKEAYRSLGRANSGIGSKKKTKKRPLREIILTDGRQIQASEAIFWYDKNNEVTHVLLVTGNTGRISIATLSDHDRAPGCRCINKYLNQVNYAINNAGDAPVRLSKIAPPWEQAIS